jgi:hypothetical protein
MMSKIILIATITLFFSGIAFSAVPDSAVPVKQIEFDIDGLMLGDELTETFFNQYCPSRSKGKNSIECKRSLKLNGIKLSVLYFFHDHRLLAISISYLSSEYRALIKTYKRKFSQSPSNVEEPILLSTGVEYTNIKSSWSTTSGEFVIEKYGNNFKKGIAYLLSDKYEKYKEKKKEEMSPGFIKKIFGDIIN